MQSWIDNLNTEGQSADKLFPVKKFTPEELESFFSRREMFPNIKPPVFIRVHDLNNTKEEPNLNKPKPAIEVGVNIPF